MSRRRLDAELVRRELAVSRTEAQRLVDARRVTVNGAVALKQASMIAPADAVEVLGPPARFVGRGGDKLAGALERFSLDVAHKRCIDVGSSTGGFTDCLLQAGAASVVALDVGRAQLHERLRADRRVLVREQTDVRSVDMADIQAPFDLVVVDVSFIGLERIITQLTALVGGHGQMVALVKPQFEAGKQAVDKGRGVITDPDIWREVLIDTIGVAQVHALVLRDLMVSPLKGGAGNVEFLALLEPVTGDHAERAGRPDHLCDEDLSRIDTVVRAASELP